MYSAWIIKLVQALPGAVLLSLLICNTDDFELCDFILDELYRDPDVINKRFFGRAFATYMNKCPLDTLDKIADILSKNVVFLLHDNYGNYLLQIFYNRNHKAGISMCEYALKKVAKRAYLRKYCRYVLLKAVVNDQDSWFCQDMVTAVSHDRHTVESILSKK